MRRERLFLEDILTAADSIAEFTTGHNLSSFIHNRLLRSAVVHQLIIIGEAASHISDATKNRHDALPWKEMRALRNIVVHNYFGTDWEEIWRTATGDIPDLRVQIAELINIEFPSGPNE